MARSDDGLERFEAVLGAISKITTEEEGLVGARCPQCGASEFVKVSDLYVAAVARADDGPASGIRAPGLTDAEILRRFRPPPRKSALGRTILVAIPLALAAFYVYRRFGSVAGQFSAMAAFVLTLTVFMTRLRQLSDQYYHARRRWNSLYACRPCGQVVAA